MTRAFTPPDTLSKEDIRTIADVRRDIWTNGFIGLFTGSLSGMALYSAAQWGYARGYGRKMHLRFDRNTAMLSVLAGGALGSFVMASTAGKNEVHNLHPIFEVGSKQQEGGTDYQRSLLRAQKRETELRDRQRNRLLRRASLKRQLEHGHGLSDSHGGQWVEERQERERNRMARRVTMKENLEKGHGLSDSHGGHWVEERQDRERNRMARRITMKENLEKGHGLSDSHGGHWVDEHDNGDETS